MIVQVNEVLFYPARLDVHVVRIGDVIGEKPLHTTTTLLYMFLQHLTSLTRQAIDELSLTYELNREVDVDLSSRYSYIHMWCLNKYQTYTIRVPQLTVLVLYSVFEKLTE